MKPGTVIGARFQIKQFLGSGGFGERYRAIDSKTDRPIDIRILHAGIIGASGIERLREEIQLAAQLAHKNIAATYGMGTEGDLHYIATEYVDGHTLRELVDQKNANQKTFSLKGAYNVIAHIANGLAYAHQTLFHGALSPTNVLVNKAGRVKITEFGIARNLSAFTQFQAQLASGDFYCMAPEIAQAPETADRRADIYSVGVILFELCTGRAPTDTFEMPSAVRPDLPRGLDQVFEKCCRPSPDERFLSAEELKQALFLAVEQTQIPQGPPARGVSITPRANTQENVMLEASSPMLSATTQQGVPQQQVAAGPRVPTQRPMPAPTPAPTPAPIPQNPLPWNIAPTPAPPSAPMAAPTPAPAPAYNGPPVDENLEIWLVQKNKLDFGPFTMAEVKRQILKGDILGEHVLVDTDSGKRWHVKNHPYLTRFVAEADMKRDEQRRLEAMRHAAIKARSRVWMFVAFLVILGGLGTAGYFFVIRPKMEKEQEMKAKELDLKAKELLARNDSSDLEKVLRDLKFEFPKPVIKQRRRGKGGKMGFSGADDFDEPTKLGDLTQEGGDEQLSPEQIQSVMNSKGRALALCIGEEKRRNPGLSTIELEFIVHGNGQVSAVRANGQKGTPLASCMFQKMRAINFPKFNGPKTIAGFTWNVR